METAGCGRNRDIYATPNPGIVMEERAPNGLPGDKPNADAVYAVAKGSHPNLRRAHVKTGCGWKI